MVINHILLCLNKDNNLFNHLFKISFNNKKTKNNNKKKNSHKKIYKMKKNKIYNNHKKYKNLK